MAYAEVSDLEARWRTLTETEEETAVTLLGDAQLMIDAECPPPEELAPNEAEARKIVSCNMVKRAMLNSEQAAGIESTQATAGPFSRSFNFSNPTGDLYLTKKDRKLLGCGGQRAFMIDLTPPHVGGVPWTGTSL